MKSYVGLDVHSKRSVYVVQDATGRERARGDIPTTPEGFGALRKQHRLAAGTAVALESGTMAFYASRQLSSIGLSPVVVDAREVRLKAHRPRQKSDTRDAQELCEGIRRGIYRAIVHVPPPQIDRLRLTLSRRRHFVRLQTAEINAAKRLLRAAGLQEVSRVHLGSLVGWQRLLARLSVHEDLRGFVELHFVSWRTAREQRAVLEHDLSEQGRGFHDDLERLKSVPGVGDVVALTTLAIFSDIERFPSAKHAASYAGLVPQTWQSADADRHGHITKAGSPELRFALCQAAHHARLASHPLHDRFVRLVARVGYRRAIVAISHQLSRILYALLRDKRSFDPARLKPDRPQRAVSSPRIYRLEVRPASSTR